MKRPIDKLREGAGMIDISSLDDPSAVSSMMVVGDRLHAIKGGGIYRLSLADDIDPGRTNPSIPNAHQRVLNRGSDSASVSRTLLLAHELFCQKFQVATVDCKLAVSKGFEIAQYLVAMEEILHLLSNEQQEKTEQASQSQARNSFALPSIQNLNARCTDFIQKADHALGRILDIGKICLGEKAAKGWFEGFANVLIRQYGAHDEFGKYFLNALPFLKSIRAMRNCVEHPKQGQAVTVSDFMMTSSGEIRPPSIKIVHPHLNQEGGLVSFMEVATTTTVDIAEAMIVGLASRHIAPSDYFPVQIYRVPENARRNRFVEYGYGIWTGTDFTPAS